MFVAAGLLIVCILILLAYRWYVRNFNYWTHHKNIPSVRGRIFSGNVLDGLLFKTNFGFNMKTVYEDPKFQNEAVVGVYGVEPALLVRDPELIKSILVRDFDCFRNRFMQANAEYDSIGGRALIFAEYSLWKGPRSKVSPIFSSGKLKQMYPLIQQVGEHLESFIRKNGDSGVYDLKDLAGRFATEAFATTVFGINSNSLENPAEPVNANARQLTYFNLRRGLNFVAISFAPKLRKIFKPHVLFKETEDFFKSTAKTVVGEREKSGSKRNDMIDIFVKLKEEAKANGQDMNIFMDSVAAHMAMFMAGGHETSSSTIANILYELAKQPETQERLRKEIVDAFVEGNGSIPYEVLHNLEYLDMIFHETLRIYPVFPVIDRKFSKHNNKGENYSLRPFYDYDIPDGMGVYISACGINNDPQYWNNPAKFDPERFSPENKKSINPMVFLPFGDGPRNCIGARLAHIQVKAGVVYILKNHFVKVCAQTNLNPKFNAKSFITQILGGINLEIVKDDLYKRTAVACK